LKGTRHITNRARNLMIAVVALLYLAIVAHDYLMVRPMLHRPFAGFLLLRNNFVPVFYLSDWEGFKRGIKFGDVVTAVEGKPVTEADQVRAIIAATRPGAPLTYSILRGEQKLKLTIPVTVFEVRDMVLPSLTWRLMGMVLVLSGLVVFYLKPNLRASRAFLFCGMVTGFSLASAPGYCLINANDLPLLSLPLVGPSVLALSLYFPVERKGKKYYLAFIALTSLPIIFFNLYSYYFLDVAHFLIVDKIFLAHLIVTFNLGAWLMFRSMAVSRDAMVRLKAKIVVFGAVAGTLGCTVGIFAVVIFKLITFFWMFIPMALFPLTLGYAIIKHNLFDVDVVIRRSVSYMVASGIMLVIFIVLIVGLSLMLENFTGSSSQIAAALSTLVIAILFRPLLARVDRELDRRFFRVQYEYQATIQKASEVLVSIIELDQLLGRILDTIVDAMQIERGMILLRDPEPKALQPAAAKGYVNPEGLIFLPLSHPLGQDLEEKRRAWQYNDLEAEGLRLDRKEEMLQWMREAQVALVIPIYFERRLIGVLGLGEKKSGAWYSSEDIRLLATLMMQTAVSIENARKVEALKKMVELETSYRELKRVDEMKDNFLSMVSHDLRAPMTSIQGYAEILRERLGPTETGEQQLCLDTIIKESERMTRLINNLLEIQRFEAGMADLDLQDLDLAQVVQEAVTAFQGAAYSKQIRLESEPCSPGWRVRGDSDRLAQVMANLLSNAIKFTPSGGQVRVAVKPAAENGKSMVRVTISDNGPGIRPEVQGKLFDKFQQGDRLARVKERGSGLGLALVRQIIEHHGGRVGLESEPGQGSQFYFLLPVQA